MIIAENKIKLETAADKFEMLEVPGGGHCLFHCFAKHFKENKDCALQFLERNVKKYP